MVFAVPWTRMLCTQLCPFQFLCYEHRKFPLFLLISRMHAERTAEIGFLDVLRLFFGPLFNAHFLYQTEIEKLGVMWSGGCLVRIGMKMIAGKVRALITICNSFLTRASEYGTRFVVTQKRYYAFCISASFTPCLIYGQVEFFGNAPPYVHVRISEKCWAVETIQSAW